MLSSFSKRELLSIFVLPLPTAMDTFAITLFPSGKTFASEDLRSNIPLGRLMPFEQQALQFCRNWLGGQKAFDLHTSGSTGVPKAITLTSDQMAASARMTGKALQLQARDRALVNLNTQYIAGIMMLVRGMEIGLHLTIEEPSATPLSEFGKHVCFDFLSFVPLQLQNTLEKEPEKAAVLNCAKAIIVGGAPISTDLEEMLQAIKAPIYQTYGMTETVSHVALRRLNGWQRQDYYTLLKGVQMSMDERGCAIIDTPLPGLTPVVTNDVIEMLTPSTFRWLGRADNVINSGGVKVQAEKVEQVIEKIFGNFNIKKRFFVSGLPHTELGEAVTLFVEGEPSDNLIENYLIEQLHTFLTKYEVPKTIRYVSSFAETPTGKIDKRTTLTVSIS